MLACNLINNQPMTIAFTRILLHDTFSVGVGPLVQRASTFAVILGSNLGANFTLIGAVLWPLLSAVFPAAPRSLLQRGKCKCK
jgi:Na+/H+ antiporter NhaD/arsenite permease-like protein